MARHVNSGYPYIRAWGISLGSTDHYIREQQEKAKRMNAPADAIFLRHHPLSRDDPDHYGESEEWARFSSLSENRQREVQRVASTANFRGRGVDIELILPERTEA